MSEVKLNVATIDGNQLIIREGKAPDMLPIREPQKIVIAGDIKTVANFLKVRKTDASGLQVVDKTKSVVTIDKKEMTLVLQLDPENFYGAVISGKLELSDEVKVFGINTDKTYNRQELARLIKFNRNYFNDKDIHAKVLSSIMKVRVKTEQELKAENDNRGNKAVGFEQKVDAGADLAKEFVLLIPVFKGFDPVAIIVEVCIDVSDSTLHFWLESPELMEMIQSSRDQIFADQLTDCTDMVVINK